MARHAKTEIIELDTQDEQYRKRYPLADIAGIFFESRNNWSNALRVRTYNYRSKSFPAGTLRHRQWLDFGRALKRRGIEVKNELPGIKQEPKTPATADSR